MRIVDNHDNLLLRRSNGSYFIDPDWPDEIMLDTRTASNRNEIAGILNGWISECKDAGYDAVEPDNLDVRLPFCPWPCKRVLTRIDL